MAITIASYRPLQSLYEAARQLLDAQKSGLPLDLSALGAAVEDLEKLPHEREEYAAYINEAREQANDDLEIDDDPVLSPAEGGVWVSSWIWVADSGQTESAHMAGELGIDKQDASLLLQSLCDMAGVDYAELQEYKVEVLPIDDLVGRRTGCGSGDRLIEADAVQELKAGGVTQVCILVTEPEQEIAAMVAQVSMEQAELFAETLEDASLRPDTTEVKGWVCFESE